MAELPYYRFTLEDENYPGQTCDVNVEFRPIEYLADETVVLAAIKTALEGLPGSILRDSFKRYTASTEF